MVSSAEHVENSSLRLPVPKLPSKAVFGNRRWAGGRGL
jgi:hypothetical protein